MISILKKVVLKFAKKVDLGTHNGMKSVQQEIASNEFPRVRVGIGAPLYKNDMINYVLGQVPKEEKEILQKGVQQAANAVIDILKHGIDYAMNQYN